MGNDLCAFGRPVKAPVPRSGKEVLNEAFIGGASRRRRLWRRKPRPSDPASTEKEAPSVGADLISIVSIVRTLLHLPCASPETFLDASQLCTASFALYQLARPTGGDVHGDGEDTDFVPGVALAELLREHLVGVLLPAEFEVEAFVARLVWFAGRQIKVSRLQSKIRLAVEEMEQSTGTNNGLTGKATRANSGRLLLECVPIKRFFCALILMSQSEVDAKIEMLELIERKLLPLEVTNKLEHRKLLAKLLEEEIYKVVRLLMLMILQSKIKVQQKMAHLLR